MSLCFSFLFLPLIFWHQTNQFVCFQSEITGFFLKAISFWIYENIDLVWEKPAKCWSRNRSYLLHEKDPEVSEQYQILLNLWTVCNFMCAVISELTGCLSSVSNNTDAVICFNKLVSLNVNYTLRAGSMRRHRDIIQVFMLDVMRQYFRNK